MLYAFLVATILITLAELGDKSQLLALGFATKYRPSQVLIGIFAASLVMFLVATAAGQLIGNLIPEFWLAIVTGVLFIVFGIWTLRGDGDEDEDAGASSAYGPIVTTAIAFLLAEFGDKTQIMTLTIAADPEAMARALRAVGPGIGDALASLGVTGAGLSRGESFTGVWLGATLGMMIADAAAIVLGAVLGKHLPQKLVTRISGTIFLLFGVGSIASALLR